MAAQILRPVKMLRLQSRLSQLTATSVVRLARPPESVTLQSSPGFSASTYAVAVRRASTKTGKDGKTRMDDSAFKLVHEVKPIKKLLIANRGIARCICLSFIEKMYSGLNKWIFRLCSICKPVTFRPFSVHSDAGSPSVAKNENLSHVLVWNYFKSRRMLHFRLKCL